METKKEEGIEGEDGGRSKPDLSIAFVLGSLNTCKSLSIAAQYSLEEDALFTKGMMLMSAVSKSIVL